MAPLEQTGKQKAARIPLDYHKRPDALARGRLWLTLLALASAGGWGYFALRHPGSTLSPGPVAFVHATWDDQCAACHVPFAPIRADGINFSGKPGSVVDERCQACHRGAAHHAAQKPGEIRRCSSCHHEHLGRNAPIARTDDWTCVNCHDDLPLHTSRSDTLLASGPLANVRVTDFSPGNHPQFRSAQSDPGRLKFSHRRHLAPGLNLGAEDRFPARRLSDLAAGDRSRFRTPGQKDDDLIHLDCAACHRSETGDYMLPVNYEHDCRACHQLNYEPESSQPKSAGVLPHGLQPSEIERFLQGVYTSAYLDSDAAFLKAPPADQRLPGKPEPAESPAAKAAIREQVARADTYLRGRCQQCHELAGMPTQAAIEPTKVPSVWLAHARFDHGAHRAVDCRVCHAQEYLYRPSQASAGWPALDNRDVLLPKAEVCFRCHAPRSAAGSGGARFDCVECHVYHAADQSSHTRGNAARGAMQRWPLDEFLHGGMPGKTP